MSVRDELGNVCDRRVGLHLFSIGNPAVSETVALRNAMRVYGQHRICLQVLSGQSIRLSGVEQLTFDDVDGACLWNVVSDEQRQLHDLGDSFQNIGANDIRVYWVNRIREADGNTLAGCAGHAPAKAAVVVSAIGSPWTMAHELGHVLLGPAYTPVHARDNRNIMFSPSANIAADPPTFNISQLGAITSSRFCVSC